MLVLRRPIAGSATFARSGPAPFAFVSQFRAALSERAEKLRAWGLMQLTRSPATTIRRSPLALKHRQSQPS